MRKSFIQKNGKILSIAAIATGAALGVAGAAYGIMRFVRSRRRLGLQVEEGPAETMPAMPDEGVSPSGTEAIPPPILSGGSEEFSGMRRDRRAHRRAGNPRDME